MASAIIEAAINQAQQDGPTWTVRPDQDLVEATTQAETAIVALGLTVTTTTPEPGRALIEARSGDTLDFTLELLA